MIVAVRVAPPFILVAEHALRGGLKMSGLWEILVMAFFVAAAVCLPFQGKRWGKIAAAAFGALALLVAVGGGLDGYVRGHWRFNSGLVPVPIIGPDGNYLDGTKASQFAREWSQPSHPRDFMVACFYVLALAHIAMVHMPPWRWRWGKEPWRRPREERHQNIRQWRQEGDGGQEANCGEYQVWHNRLWPQGRIDLATASQDIGHWPPSRFPEEYFHAANVRASSLRAAAAKTMHLGTPYDDGKTPFEPWEEQQDVQSFTPRPFRPRSTDPGDVIVDPQGKAHRFDGVGFCEIGPFRELHHRQQYGGAGHDRRSIESASTDAVGSGENS
jgi:hypothetical protein